MDTARAANDEPANVHLHRDVLQRAVRQVRDAADVLVLPELGAELGLPQEGHPRGDTALQRGHHQSAGGRDGSVLQLLPAGAEARRLWRHLFAEVAGEAHGRERKEIRRRVRHLFSDEQVHADKGTPGGVQSARDGERRRLGAHAEPRHAQGQHRPCGAAQNNRGRVGEHAP